MDTREVLRRLAAAFRAAWREAGGWGGCAIPPARRRPTGPAELADFFVAAEFLRADLAAGSADAWDTVRVKMGEIVKRLRAWPGRLKRSRAPGSLSADWVRVGDWTPKWSAGASAPADATIQFQVRLCQVGLGRLRRAA